MAAFSSALFLPLIGKGFVHDDFVWLSSAAHESRWYGLTHPTQLFYTPLSWLTVKVEWTLWGFRAFPFAVTNLLIHILNTILLYWLALRLWQSFAAAWWAAFGFALLYIANSWAVMWLAARAHMLATLFCLAAMHACICYARSSSGRRRLLASAVILACAALSMLSKEIGVTSVAVVALMVLYAGGVRRLRDSWPSTLALMVGLLIILSVYLSLRARAGAVPVMSDDKWYHYTFEFKVLISNLREYLSRTYLMCAILAGAIALSQFIRGVRPRLSGVTAYEVALSVMLFSVMIAPVILLPNRSGLYTYMPGIGAALLLGATARALYASSEDTRRQTLLNLSPIFLVVAALSVATVGQSLKWITMARTSTAILEQIAAQQPRVSQHTNIILRYSERDGRHRFPDAFGTWSFAYAVKLLYGDPTLSGEIVPQGAALSAASEGARVEFIYLTGDEKPKIVKSEKAHTSP